MVDYDCNQLHGNMQEQCFYSASYRLGVPVRLVMP